MVDGDRLGLGRVCQCLPRLVVRATPSFGPMGNVPSHPALFESRRLVNVRRACVVRRLVIRRVPPHERCFEVGITVQGLQPEQYARLRWSHNSVQWRRSRRASVDHVVRV